jgi:hypothetical protein
MGRDRVEGRRWQWRRVGVPGVPEWEALLPDGDLRDAGAVVTVADISTALGRCWICGRRGRMWHGMVELPVPIDFVPLGLGCTRAHAVAAAPMSWATLAVTLADRAAALRADVVAHKRLEETAQLVSRQADTCAFLAGASPAERHLALRLWADCRDLNVSDVATVTAGVLAGVDG